MDDPRSGVAVLCASARSVYHGMAGVIVFDPERDARSFRGGMPVVAHPPCRAWSAFCRHQAKPEPGEAELGAICIASVTEWGGVLEHPAHSRLWDRYRLPRPGESDGKRWCLEVWQKWWGYPNRKRTWLLFSGVDRASVRLPFRLLAEGAERETWQRMGKKERSKTVPEFAQWLVDVARNAKA